MSKASDLYVFRGMVAGSQRVVGSIPRDPEGMAFIDGLKTATVHCFLLSKIMFLKDIYIMSLIYEVV